jgi:hypothetical protein
MSFDPIFDRPLIIVSPPRSGSTMLFETLARAPNLYTVGGESHMVIEGMPELSMVGRKFSSNRLTADDARPEITETLRTRFLSQMRDRDGAAPTLHPFRMLEKTPKNALRIPFLARVFPEARFIYLHRDVRQTLSSMIEAWRSGGFQTYRALPDWSGPPWSLLLVPGWRALAGKPLGEIVARQWQICMDRMLDDLDAIPANRQLSVRYEALTEDWGAEIGRVCRLSGLAWDGPTEGPLALSRYTVTKPDPEKWRANASDIEPYLAQLAQTIEKAEKTAVHR